MSRNTRRRFLTLSAGGLAAAGATAVLGDAHGQTQPAASRPISAPAPLVHHVLFWLKRPDSTEDRDALVAGIRSLGAIETVRAVHVGLPADTMARGVVDGSWSVSEILYFDDAAGQDAYQVDPLHQAFVDQHEHLWERVVVYDVMGITGP
ncbi:MAG: Dabb family protein [Pseudomonadota bacterium]